MCLSFSFFLPSSSFFPSGGPAQGYVLLKAVFFRGLLSYQQLLPLLPSPPFHLLPVRVVQTAEPDTFDLLVAAATGVAVAVVSEDEASGAAGHNGVTADGSLRGTQTANGKHRQLTLNTNIR